MAANYCVQWRSKSMFFLFVYSIPIWHKTVVILFFCRADSKPVINST